MTETVDAWMEQFGEIDPFERSKPNTFEFELEVAYYVEIKSAMIVHSKKGDVQLKLALIILKGSSDDAPEVGRHFEYITLPKQASDIELGNYELVSKLTQRRMADVVRLLSAANRSEDALYDRVDRKDGRSVYYDFAGQPMSSEEFKKREAEIHEKVIEFVDEAHKSVGQYANALDDTRLFIKRVPNKKSPKYPYLNLYAQRPRDGAVFGEADAPF